MTYKLYETEHNVVQSKRTHKHTHLPTIFDYILKT